MVLIVCYWSILILILIPGPQYPHPTAPAPKIPDMRTVYTMTTPHQDIDLHSEGCKLIVACYSLVGSSLRSCGYI